MAKRVIVSSIGVVCLVVVMVLLSSHANAIECQEAITKLLPCESYLLGASDITPQCCQSADALNQIATSKPVIKSLCECFKGAALALHVNVDRAKALPDLCKIKVPVPIDPNVDCSEI